MQVQNHAVSDLWGVRGLYTTLMHLGCFWQHHTLILDFTSCLSLCPGMAQEPKWTPSLQCFFWCVCPSKTVRTNQGKNTSAWLIAFVLAHKPRKGAKSLILIWSHVVTAYIFPLFFVFCLFQRGSFLCLATYCHGVPSCRRETKSQSTWLRKVLLEFCIHGAFLHLKGVCHPCTHVK